MAGSPAECSPGLTLGARQGSRLARACADALGDNRPAAGARLFVQILAVFKALADAKV